MDTMEEKVCTSIDVPVFDKNDYFGWRAKMKGYLKSMEFGRL